jgi:hypothetical protein
MGKKNFQKLGEENYSTWSVYMKADLICKGIWDIVDGSETQPPGSPSSKLVCAFIKKQQLAQSQLTLAVEAEQIPHLHEHDPVKSWENLRQVHTARGFSSRLALRRRFLTMKKDESQSMQLWISSVKQVSQRLSQATNPPSDKMDNSCHRWLKAREDDEMILVLTNGLVDSYHDFVISLNSVPQEDLTLNYVISRLLNEESRQLAHQDHSETQALTATCSRPAKRPLKAICSNCKGLGHCRADCPQSSPE